MILELAMMPKESKEQIKDNDKIHDCVIWLLACTIVYWILKEELISSILMSILRSNRL